MTSTIDTAPIRSFLEQRMSAGHAPGAIIAMTDQERMLGTVSRGVADVTTAKPYDAGSLIRLGSLTKPFVALVVLQEIERGTLALDTRVSDVLPWCELREPHGPITVHHLLTHTAGLPRGSDASIDPLFAVYQLREVDAGSPPGTHFHYSNDGWKLIGVLLEAITGTSLQGLIRDRVLAPLGMTGSVARIEAHEIENLVPGYCRLQHGRPLTCDQPLLESPWTPYAGADGCVAATAEDMCRFARMILNQGIAAAGRLISRESFDAMLHRWAQDEEIGGWYGYGWWVFERAGSPFYMHLGYQPGSSCVLVIDPTAGTAAFCAANGIFNVRAQSEYALAVIRAARAGQPPPRQPRTTRADRIMEAADYAGEYCGDGHFELIAEGDGLRFRSGAVDVLAERVDATMRASFPAETFLVRAPDFDRHFIEFERDPDGAVVRAYHGFQNYGRLPHAPDDFPLPPEWRAYCGSYRGWKPTTPFFDVVGRQGRLWLLDSWGTQPLVPVGGSAFRIGYAAWGPERLVFSAVTARGATRVTAADREGAWYRISEGSAD